MRKKVLAEFEQELKLNVLTRTGDESVNYFFLVTNVPCSSDALAELDKKRRVLLKGRHDLHADIWWQERVTAELDLRPSLWASFPDMFPGGKVPLIAAIVNQNAGAGLPRAMRLALQKAFERDSSVRFKQIGLETTLQDLFVELDVRLPDESAQPSVLFSDRSIIEGSDFAGDQLETSQTMDVEQQFYSHRRSIGTLRLLMFESNRMLHEHAPSARNKGVLQKIILEGGPGQGKSTVTQMLAQIYRRQLLNQANTVAMNRWPITKVRLPFRVDLKDFVEYLTSNPEASVEEYLASIIKKDSGGSAITVDDIHTLVEFTPVLLIFDGLDEVGSDEQRSQVLEKIMDCIHRFEDEDNLHCDLKVILTTRPPAIAGHQDQLIGFSHLPIMPLTVRQINEYVARWVKVQCKDPVDANEVLTGFRKREGEPHVAALIKNPMQLTVLLHFIRMQGAAFPSNRAELYREYFRTVINRDVDKTPALAKHRPIIEALHQYLGYKIHAMTETQQAEGSFSRKRLLGMVSQWLESRGADPAKAAEMFKLGEERLGLLVALKGDGENAYYGFEIQPIREFFAAAYFNDQIGGNAHEVFQQLLHRQYWREVALFLAGLSKPNEKADLIARARDADKQSEFSWRQDGRTVIFQLLQEGIFSDLPYVFTDALDFILELLDPGKIPAQVEPPHFFELLRPLLDQESVNEEKRQLRIKSLTDLMRKYTSCEDELVVRRIFNVASYVLKPESMRQALLAYKAENEKTIVSARLRWPYQWGIDMSEPAQSPSYWNGASPRIWAKAWWNTAVNFDKATGLPGSIAYHQLLTEQFAIRPIRSARFIDIDQSDVIEPRSNWAIWYLERNIRFIASFRKFGTIVRAARSQTPGLAFDNPPSLPSLPTDIDYSGLDSRTSSILKDLVVHSYRLGQSMANDVAEVRPALKSYAEVLRKTLNLSGLSGWIGWHCTASLIGSLSGIVERLGTNIGFEVPSRHFADRLEEFIQTDPDIGPLNHAFEEQIIDLDFEPPAGSIIQSRWHSAFLYDAFPSTYWVPQYIRQEDAGNLMVATDIIAEAIHTGRTRFDWFMHIPIRPFEIRPLVEKCRDCLLELMAFLGEHDFIPLNWVHWGHPLMISDVQRIIKLARTETDPQVLNGILVALSTSRFIRVAQRDVILKLIKASNRSPDIVAYFLESRMRNRIRFENGTLDGQKITDELTIMVDVVKSIVNIPSEYSFKIVSTATRLLTETTVQPLPPLLNEEQNLGLS